MNDAAIGVFDSGIGGLTVAKEIKKLLPRERVIYLGDTARLPFGSKSPATIQRYSLQIAEFLLKRGIKILVIACNTASAWALEQVEAFSPVPVVGVILPGCSEAVKSTRKKKVGVICTSATRRSEAYPVGIRELDPQIHVVTRQCPLFVPLVEEGWLDSEATDLIIAEYLAPLKQQNIDTLVLGCTHYPLLKQAISRFMGDEVEIICSSEATAKEVKKVITRLDYLREHNGEKDLYYLTDYSPSFQRITNLFMEDEKIQVEQVDISYPRQQG